jgi:hypothetical protein
VDYTIDFDRQVVIERPADIVKPNTRVRDGLSVVGSSRLDDEDLRARGGQFRSKNRTGRTCPTTMRSYRFSSFNTLVILTS